MVQAAEDFAVVAEVESREVEEGEQVAVADVEEEMGRAGEVTVLEEFGQRKPEHALVEVDRGGDVGTDEGEVVDPTPTRRWAVGDRAKIAVAHRGPFVGSVAGAGVGVHHVPRSYVGALAGWNQLLDFQLDMHLVRDQRAVETDGHVERNAEARAQDIRPHLAMHYEKPTMA